jgi:hypothetical protein
LKARVESALLSILAETDWTYNAAQAEGLSHCAPRRLQADLRAGFQGFHLKKRATKGRFK